MRPAFTALCVALALAPHATGAAETRMTAAEFDAYVTGRTLYYATQGQEAYGAEQYLPGRKVIWTFLDGDCAEGLWYEEDGLICFIYDLDLVPQCWSFWSTGTGITAHFENDPAATALYELKQSDEPLICRGPGVGV
jgi:hypothetical protein